MQNLEKITQDLKFLGISSSSNMISENEISTIKSKMLKSKRKKGDKRSHLPLNKVSTILKVLKLQFNDISFAIYLKNLAKKLELKKIANSFFGEESKLVNIDYYINEKSTKPVLDWHVDKAYSGKKEITKFVKPEDFGLKFIFYLTDVSNENGCLKYVPYSNKVAYALKKAIYKKEINYSPYWGKDDFCKLVNLNKEVIKRYVSQEDLNNYYNEIKNLENKKNLKNFSYEIKTGGAVIFDESGIHKGTEPRFNDRMIFRYIYQKKSN